MMESWTNCFWKKSNPKRKKKKKKKKMFAPHPQWILSSGMSHLLPSSAHDLLRNEKIINFFSPIIIWAFFNFSPEENTQRPVGMGVREEC
jgi:hypothetical protein